MSVLSDTPSSRTPSPPNLPYPRSKICVVNSRVGFKFQGADELQALSSASRLDLVRQKHLSHIGALRDDGFDFLPPDVAQALNENLISPATLNPPFQFPPPPTKMTWKDRLLASASASTLKIKGITKKLKNKVILLRDVVVPSAFNPPPPPTYHSAATPATPTPFANLPPPTKHEFSTQRIVCIRDLGLALEEEDAKKSGRLFGREDEDDVNSLMSPAWPQRKHLSTLPEESDGLTSHLSDDEDDGPHPDVFVEAVLMPVENLGVPGAARGLTSPRSRVSPPWMHQTLHDASTSTLRLGGGQNARERPLTSSSAGDVKTPLNAAISPSSSILRFDGFRPSGGDDSQLLSPYHARRQSVLSFLSSTASSYGTNARRRASSLVMLPLDGGHQQQHPSHRGSRASSGRQRSSTFSGGPDKENHNQNQNHRGSGYASATFGKNAHPRTKLHHQVDEHYDEGTESDEEDEEEEQEYYVFEADPRDVDPTSPVKEGPDGKRESVLVLLPVPNDEAEARDLKSRWSRSDLGSMFGGDQHEEDVHSNPFLTPFGIGGRSLPPSSTYDPSVRDSRYSRGSHRGWDRNSYATNTNTGTGTGRGGTAMGGRLASAWEAEEEEEPIEPYHPEGELGTPTTTTNPFLTPAVSGMGKPLPNIPTPSDNPSTWSLGSYKTAPTTLSRNQSNSQPPMSRKGSSGQIPTTRDVKRDSGLTNVPSIPGASRNNSTVHVPATTPRSRTSSLGQQPVPPPPPPYNRHGTQVHMPGAFGARSRSRVNVPQTIEEPEPEPEELDEIDFDDEDEDEEWDEEDLAEIDEEEVLPRSVAAKRSAQGLANRPGFVALPVPIPASSRTRDRTPSDARRDRTASDARRDRTVSDARRDRTLSDARNKSREQVSGRQRTQSKASAPQSPPPPAPVSVQAQVQSAPKPSNPYQSRRILSMRDFDDQMEAEKQPAAPLPPTNPQRTPSQKKVKEAPRPLSSLNSDAVPTPVPSPSFAPAPLAPPKSKTPKPRHARKTSVSSAGSKRGARKGGGSQPKPIIVVNNNNDDYDDEEEEEEPTTPTVWRNRSQSNPATPATASTFGAPTSPVVRTRSGTKARIPIPQALLDGEQVVDIANPRQNVVRSASQKSSKVVERVPSSKAAPTRPLPPQPPIDYSPKSYGRADVATPTPSDGSRKSRTKSSNPNTPKMTYRQGLDDDGSGRMQRKEAEAFMKSSGRAFQGQACSIEVQVVDGDEGAEFGRKDGAYVDRSGSTRSKRSRRTSEQMYGSAVGSSPTFQGLPTPKSGHVRLRPSI